MATSTQAKKLERMEQRVPLHVKQTIERAAAMQGRSASDFVTQAALGAAQDVVDRNEVMRLRGEKAAAFIEAITNPKPPSDEMMERARRYWRFVGEEPGV